MNRSITIIIPTYNGARDLERLLPALQAQTLSANLVAVDSSSTDASRVVLERFGVRTHVIEPGTFDHGGTRNLAARLAPDADILVFLTQDAVPADERFLERLCAPLLRGEASAVYGRQLPRPEASLLERFSRYFNYPAQSRMKTLADVERLGVKTFFFSNVCSAVLVVDFRAVGGFPERTIMNEDMLLAARLLRSGRSVRYEATAEVVHSHAYTPVQQFRRNFDVGVFFAEYSGELQGARVGGEGVRFVLGQARYVLRHHKPELLPWVLLENAAKFAGFWLGRRHRYLPLSVKVRLSMHSYHWRSPEESR